MAPGTLDVKLWEERCRDQYCFESTCGKNDPKEAWSVSITEENYDGIFGATIRLDYKNYVVGDDWSTKGCAKIVFNSQDKDFSVRVDNIFLNGI